MDTHPQIFKLRTSNNLKFKGWNGRRGCQLYASTIEGERLKFLQLSLSFSSNSTQPNNKNNNSNDINKHLLGGKHHAKTFCM